MTARARAVLHFPKAPRIPPRAATRAAGRSHATGMAPGPRPAPPTRPLAARRERPVRDATALQRFQPDWPPARRAPSFDPHADLAHPGWLPSGRHGIPRPGTGAVAQGARACRGHRRAARQRDAEGGARALAGSRGHRLRIRLPPSTVLLRRWSSACASRSSTPTAARTARPARCARTCAPSCAPAISPSTCAPACASAWNGASAAITSSPPAAKAATTSCRPASRRPNASAWSANGPTSVSSWTWTRPLRQRMRAELGLDADAFVVATIGMLRPESARTTCCAWSSSCASARFPPSRWWSARPPPRRPPSAPAARAGR